MPSASSPPSSHPDIPPFPAPSTFSILPDIYLLIARLNILQHPPNPTSTSISDPASTQQVSSTSQAQTQTQTQTQPQVESQTQSLSQPHQPTSDATSTLQQSQSLSQTQSASLSFSVPSSQIPLLQTGPPVDLKELPAQVYPIKQKLVKARAAVTALPDIERSVDEQEQEIRELERTVGLLKKRLGLLASVATGMATAPGSSGNDVNNIGSSMKRDGDIMEDIQDAPDGGDAVSNVKQEGETDSIMQGVEG
ncbi:hypothetical protein A1O1_03181 [Capronia coronata CBS 617.96]|uniref:Mediator of RNA polymerase II transcription subunit 9 n=1 Tax=Capronia coronata CBS 617.96 TaxID=1182541 RepID=W9YQE8_9EURO|nr:uncharacterized protein A1O1_03181 [Capronia coronata CBS 617.96]EXJ94783.1 hypothetical protein A1O1_03181 [Capronia coronata CBS 617.96]